ncbi:hypothetical protein DY000_02050201 [Brassica cretica]|uniref:Uncharacterized protein n=1 Tax=Brassica cretica TaxID=69181 RepID=A0ABQ7EVD7_BRACR|nr:hypothetical protein DY000_02050201 [Brassica cretica]
METLRKNITDEYGRAAAAAMSCVFETNNKLRLRLSLRLQNEQQLNEQTQTQPQTHSAAGTCVTEMNIKCDEASTSAPVNNMLTAEVKEGGRSHPRPAPLPLELFRSSTVRLSVFDVEASQLHQKLDGVGVKPNVAEFLCTVKYKPLKPPMDGTTFPAPNVQGSFSENSGVLKYCVEMCISDAIESVSCV